MGPQEEVNNSEWWQFSPSLGYPIPISPARPLDGNCLGHSVLRKRVLLNSKGLKFFKFKLAVRVYAELFIALSTCRISCSTSPICRRDTEVACARRLPVFLKSDRHGMSLSAIAHLPLLAHDSGTVYLMMSSLPHRSQHFAEKLKTHLFRQSYTRTLFYSLVAIVVLAVIFT